MISYGHAGEDRCRTADPDVGTKTNRANPRRMRRFQLMEVCVEDGYEVSNKTIVANDYAVGGHDRGPRVHKDTLAQYKGTILGSSHFYRNRLTAQKQTSAGNRANGKKTGFRPSTVTTAERAPAQRNLAVAQRLEGTSRTLSTDPSPCRVQAHAGDFKGCRHAGRRDEL